MERVEQDKAVKALKRAFEEVHGYVPDWQEEFLHKLAEYIVCDGVNAANGMTQMRRLAGRAVDIIEAARVFDGVAAYRAVDY